MGIADNVTAIVEVGQAPLVNDSLGTAETVGEFANKSADVMNSQPAPELEPELESEPEPQPESEAGPKLKPKRVKTHKDLLRKMTNLAKPQQIKAM